MTAVVVGRSINGTLEAEVVAMVVVKEDEVVV